MHESDWNKEFVITSVTRRDLVTAGFSREVVEKITDEDMQQIASAMEDIYCDTGFWEDMELCANRIFESKESEHASCYPKPDERLKR